MGADDRQDATISNPDQMDRAVTALAHFHRRCILRYLVESSAETVSRDELVEHLQESAWTDQPPSKAELESQLHHVHFTHLEQAGLITYDARNQEVRYWENILIESLLAALPDNL